MAERVVNVKLEVQVANYLAGMEKASKATKAASEEAQKLADKKQAVELLGKTSLVMGAAIAAGVAIAVAKYAEFDQAMSNVQAATHATIEDQKLLADAAIEAGASTVFSATESANAIEELSKAGLDTADILSGALAGSLDLASAGELGVARAAEIASTTLQQFKLDGSEAGHVADVLAAGAGKAMGSVDDLANGLKFVGPVAQSMGISLEETTGVLALFAQQGIIGEQAGTGLRGVLASLTSPSSQASKEIARLNIELYDSQGKFLGMKNAAEQLNVAYGTMDDESRNASMGIIFGRETITAATTLYQAGAKGVDQWTDAVNDSGYAAETARARLDNLKGDIEQLGGAFDTALIQSGSAANDVLRTMTQGLTNLIDLYNDAPEPIKVTALAVGAVAAAALLAGGAFFLGAPKAAQFTAAVGQMGPAAQKSAALLTASAGPIGLAFAVAGVALAAFAGQQAEAKARTEAFTGTLDAQTGAVTDSTRELVKSNLAAKESFLFVDMGSAYDSAKKLGASLDTVTDAAMGNGDALKELAPIIRAGGGDQAAAQKIADKYGISLAEVSRMSSQVAKSVLGSSGSLEEAIRVTEQKAALDKEAAAKAEEHTAALDSLQGKAQETKTSISELADQIRGFGSATLSTRDAARQLEESYDALTASVEANGTSLDITAEEGRKNEAALDAIVRATLDSAAANYEQTGSQEEANAVIAAGRDELVRSLEQFGITGDAAQEYVDKLGLIKENINTAVSVNTAAAEQAITDFITTASGQTIYVGVMASPNALNNVKYSRASGGILPGAPSATDNLVINAATGEFITNAAATAKNRGVLEYINNGGVVQGFANGGQVGRDVQHERSPGAGSTSFDNSRGDVNMPINIYEASSPGLVASRLKARQQKEEWGQR